MKIAVLECCNEDFVYHNVSLLTRRSKLNYCDLHNYNFILHKFRELGRPPYWARVQGLLTHLDNYDWILNIDSDMLIVNPQIRLEQYIDEKFNVLVGMMPDYATRKAIHISTGLLFIKRSLWSKKFLQKWWDQTIFINNPYYSDPLSDHNAIVDKSRGGMFHDQSAFHYLYDHDEDCRKNIKIMPDIWLNCRDETYSDNDLLIHFAGTWLNGKTINKETRIKNYLYQSFNKRKTHL